MNAFVLYFSAFLAFFGQSLLYIVLDVLTVKTIAYNELLTGESNESIVFSVRPFMIKLGAAIQQWIVTLVLITSGLL